MRISIIVLAAMAVFMVPNFFRAEWNTTAQAAAV